MTRPWSRRDWMSAAATGAAAGLLGGCRSGARSEAPTPEEAPTGVVRGRIRQAAAGWCFLNRGEQWSVPQLVQHAVALRMPALELIDVEHWPLLKAHGLVNAATRSHGFVRGTNNPAHWDECRAALETAIEASAAAGFPNVMTFTGFSDTSDQGGSAVTEEQGVRHCVEAYGRIVGRAEAAGVTLILEPLNTRDAEAMKGHPGYMGDHVEECMDIVRQVSSPALRLLFDVYHVQVMDGDLVRRIRELREFIGHVQVAGCPGRGPLDDAQEIHYPAVMRALLEVGYQGYVAHEWIPGDDPAAELARSVRVLDV